MIYAYHRVSTRQQENNQSFEVQQQQCEGAAMILGESITETFKDVASGGKPLEKRENGKRLLDVLQPGDTLIATKLDRLFRNTADALQKIERFQEDDIHLILLDMGTQPVTGSYIGKMLLTVMAAVAEMEKERIRERLMSGKQIVRERGGYCGATPEIGTKIVNRRVINVNQDEIRGEMQAMHLKGHSLREIARSLRVSYDIPISHTTVRRHLDKIAS